MSDDRSGNDQDERSWLEKIAHLFSTEPRSRKDLIGILAIAEQNEVIDAETHGIMQGALEVATLQVRDVMIPRPQMVCLKSDDEPEAIIRRVIEAGHSRYPVIGDTSDEVLGILLAKDLLSQIFTPEPGNFEQRLRDGKVVDPAEERRLAQLNRTPQRVEQPDKHRKL